MAVMTDAPYAIANETVKSHEMWPEKWPMFMSYARVTIWNEANISGMCSIHVNFYVVLLFLLVIASVMSIVC